MHIQSWWINEPPFIKQYIMYDKQLPLNENKQQVGRLSGKRLANG